MLDNTTAPYVQNSATSREAAKLIEPHRETVAGRIYEFIVSSKGAARYEIAAALDLSVNTVNPRLRELEAGGWIRKSVTRLAEETAAMEWVWVEGQAEFYETGTTPRACGYQGERRSPSGEWQHIVVELLAHGPMNDDQIFVASGSIERHRTRLQTARLILVQKGVVMATGSTAETTSGRLGTLWTLVSEGVTPPSQGQGPRTRKATSRATEAQPYSSAESYAVGDKIEHAEHGIGYVEFVDMDGSQIEVTFPSGARELASGRQAA